LKIFPERLKLQPANRALNKFDNLSNFVEILISDKQNSKYSPITTMKLVIKW
jgi:hypothetical protein